MTKPQPHMKLGAFLQATGHHVAGWRHPDAEANAGRSIAHYRQIAQTAERAKFDALFLADGVAIRAHDTDTLYRTARGATFEPLTLLSALSAVTERIGLVATVSTTYNEPFHVARKFASLDHLSDGRAGWNVVTSWSDAEARNFNLDKHPEHGARYERAEEFVDVVKGLWDSWEDDAFTLDKASGTHFDPTKLHTLNHHGRHFSVRGPLNVARPIQGHPVIVQAGSSERGQELAARTAEVIFTAQQSLEDAQKFYAGLKGKLAKYGRDPSRLKIMPGVFPVVGRTEAEAQEKHEQLQSLIDPSVGLAMLSHHLGGIDLTGYPLDGPIPHDLQEPNGTKSRFQLVSGIALKENLTLRQLSLRVATARGHWSIYGTPESIVDRLEDWFLHGAADGFNIMPPTLPGGLDDFVALVLPELRRRGLFRTEYEGRTLRDHLGLARPPHQRKRQEEVAA
ncbi:LLM class flavin-dependent oxidoreductase [Glaciimonas sp. PAMC28666]|uniref:LLM class flavin-dependent oxidoreductase n=1 Tax=Glaciimonas sp. PAMC28666 TaxID=2807626 RepID=UPI0019664929|nr:LLM class flavin-dependent oxidoreductase [Glaciimonas sp. PAMC28666]QRX83291.1 LLM class flavin-dependent oxidoreductase [Glaciimonas sp. PAMC28666]